MTVKVPFRAPAMVGVNVTVIVQLPPAARLEPQLLVCAKSPELEPVKPMLLILKAVFWGLVSVSFWPGLVVFKYWFPNVNAIGDTVTGVSVKNSDMLFAVAESPG